MSLIIRYTNSIGMPQQREWHYGEPLPRMDARVVVLQADGDELELIIDALKKTRSIPTIAAEVVADPKLEADNENPDRG
jgi:hypothetical protein